MAYLYDTSSGLVSADPFAPSRREQSRADCAADCFDLTEREYRAVLAIPAARREAVLLRRLAEFDDHRRQIIGVFGSLPGGVAYNKFWADWNANAAENAARVWAAFDRAAAAFGSQVAA
jgi:hypothetical protein